MADYSGSGDTGKTSVSSGGSSSALLLASMGLTAFSSVANIFEQTAAINAQSDIEESIAQTNAELAKMQEAQVKQEGEFEASRKNLETESAVGTERANQGASGISVDSASSRLMRLGTIAAGGIDELTIRNNASRAAFGLESESLNDTYKAQFTKLNAGMQTQQTILTGGLKAIEAPLAIESNYLRFSRYMGGGGGGASSRLPFDVTTN